VKRYIALILIVAVCLVPAAALAQGQEDTLVIAASQHIVASVATVAQNIRVDGVVDGDVTSWSGEITIAGSVGGDVVSYGGSVTVLATGRVRGNILATGGALRLDAGAVVAGQAIDAGGGGALASLLDLLDPSNAGASDAVIGRTLFSAAVAVLLMAFCLLYLAFWPGRIAVASATLSRLPGQALWLGLLTTLILALAVLPLAGLLVASVVGVPVLLVLLALMLALYVYGLVVLARALSTRVGVYRASAPGGAIAVTTLALVLVIAVVTAFAPLEGLAIFYLVASPGLGALIVSRGGIAVPLAAQ
jgi:hypothetical protein